MQKVRWSVESLVLLILIVWMWENYLAVLQTRGKAEQKKAKRAWKPKARTPDHYTPFRELVYYINS